MLDRPAEAAPHRFELHQPQHLGQGGASGYQREQRLDCIDDRLVGGERAVADLHRHRKWATLEDRFHEWSETSEVGAEHQHLVRLQRGVGDERVPQHFAEHLQLPHLAVTRVHLERSVGGIDGWVARGLLVEAHTVLQRLQQRGGRTGGRRSVRHIVHLGVAVHECPCFQCRAGPRDEQRVSDCASDVDVGAYVEATGQPVRRGLPRRHRRMANEHMHVSGFAERTQHFQHRRGDTADTEHRHTLR
ncbi:unannotated protein [freshwater metagenome]|uniref:Unannotated protein n=1 Tax=freshwater metagenome TaxID=449393 RepID=A0A6J7JU83_9ZZZZ